MSDKQYKLVRWPTGQIGVKVVGGEHEVAFLGRSGVEFHTCEEIRLRCQMEYEEAEALAIDMSHTDQEFVDAAREIT